MKFYFIIKSLFSIRVFKTLAPYCSPSGSCVVDIVVVYSSIDTLNVIYANIHLFCSFACHKYMFTHLPIHC